MVYPFKLPCSELRAGTNPAVNCFKISSIWKPARTGSVYAYSFYSMFPNRSTNLDAMSDYMAVKSVFPFVQKNTFGAVNSSDWSWGDLRNVNYFIANNKDPKVPEAVRNNYTGISQIFQSLFLL